MSTLSAPEKVINISTERHHVHFSAFCGRVKCHDMWQTQCESCCRLEGNIRTNQTLWSCKPAERQEANQMSQSSGGRQQQEHHWRTTSPWRKGQSVCGLYTLWAVMCCVVNHWWDEEHVHLLAATSISLCLEEVLIYPSRGVSPSDFLSGWRRSWLQSCQQLWQRGLALLLVSITAGCWSSALCPASLTAPLTVSLWQWKTRVGSSSNVSCDMKTFVGNLFLSCSHKKTKTQQWKLWSEKTQLIHY